MVYKSFIPNKILRQMLIYSLYFLMPVACHELKNLHSYKQTGKKELFSRKAEQILATNQQRKVKAFITIDYIFCGSDGHGS